ncbi:MAG TPA: CoA pyrophosphatase [Rubrivivax sp.]|nr:CoA pyrophosphatase [Rubrivivax sp.]
MTTPPRILDPRAVPVAGHDSHLPPISSDRLTAPALRERFAWRRDWQAEHPGDGGRFFPDRLPVQAAVLIPLVQRPDGLHVLLTRRTEHLRDHAGQISFPGGRSEPTDAGATGTALREAAEEVGLPADRVEVIGEMPIYTTVTHYVVTPVVGLVHPPFELIVDKSEVDEAFEVPLGWLMDPGNHRRHVFSFEGGQREFLSMPWRCARGEYFIWGATAAMLRNLYRYLADELPRASPL